jgi:multidrug efflux pump subunit AcrA (membrane-fusion protein)
MYLLIFRGHYRSRRLAGLAVTMALATLGIACSGGAASAPPPQAAGIPVKVESAKLIPVEDTTEYVATLKSRDTAVIMPQVEGQITKIFVHSGTQVSAETPLMQIDPDKQQATLKTQEDTLAAKQAELVWDQQEYERNKGLYDAKVISKQAFDQSKTALDQARAQLQALEAQVRQETVQLRYYRVTAGSTGIVGDIPVRVGDRVTTTTQLTTVDKPGSLEAYVYVPVERSSQLKLNLPVQIVDQSGSVVAESRINFVSPRWILRPRPYWPRPQSRTIMTNCAMRNLSTRASFGERKTAPWCQSSRFRGWAGNILPSWRSSRTERQWRTRSHCASET